MPLPMTPNLCQESPKWRQCGLVCRATLVIHARSAGDSGQLMFSNATSAMDAGYGPSSRHIVLGAKRLATDDSNKNGRDPGQTASDG